ncbi:hypothetical protein VPH35_078278 [Triticum aestivum]
MTAAPPAAPRRLAAVQEVPDAATAGHRLLAPRAHPRPPHLPQPPAAPAPLATIQEVPSPPFKWSWQDDGYDHRGGRGSPPPRYDRGGGRGGYDDDRHHGRHRASDWPDSRFGAPNDGPGNTQRYICI